MPKGWILDEESSLLLGLGNIIELLLSTPVQSLSAMSTFVTAISVESQPPSLHDNTGDLDRLREAVLNELPEATSVEIPFERLVPLCRKFRDNGFKGTILVNRLNGRWVVADVLAGVVEKLPAVALDLGTTHLEARLIDLLTGNLLSEANRENAQIGFGTDILSRIHHATAARRRKKVVAPDFKDPGMVELQSAIVSCINELCLDLADQAHCSLESLCCLAVSGNTTMVHLFLGLDPYHICREPYIPQANAVDPVEARELDLHIHPAAPVWIMPSVGSYFGGDLISGIIATNISRSKETRMMIDVGTNAEVVLGNSEWLIACAGAAGPALEGGVAKMGMRAGPGAVENISIDSEDYTLSYRTIGDLPARGICGSGLIDLVAALFLNRVIDIRGKFRQPDNESDPERAAFMADRLIRQDDQLAFVVVFEEESDQGRAVLLEQIDLDAMIRSKAAMYSILTTLVNQVGIEFGDLEEICVAGAFGRHINPERAVTLGMLPDLDLSVFRVVGNSSLAGAEMVLLDGAARRQCYEIIQKITYLELNVNQEFMIRFSGSRFIPHTDPSLFPSVPRFDGE
ncbi:MAG: ASKHA domain-containing protein [Thermodesulfobacteriota bacterium]